MTNPAAAAPEDDAERSHIAVTARHIRDGTPRSPRSCPIALALAGQGWNHVRVSEAAIHVESERFHTYAPLARWIHSFDQSDHGGPPATPFTLVLAPANRNYPGRAWRQPGSCAAT